MENLCRRIGMPEEVNQFLFSWQPEEVLDLSPLMREETWESGLKAIKAKLGEDPRGLKILWCMLRCAVDAKKQFDDLGFSDEIYYDTMACFSRFVGEYREQQDAWGFHLDFWAVRQISGTLFRIGELEYELVRIDGQRWISLHLPTDIRLELPLLRESYLLARQEIARAFPDYAQAPMYCMSWIMSPVLQELLPPSSRILAFQRNFTITAIPVDDPDYLVWIVKKPGIPLQDLPENTTLQRKIKAYLLQGKQYSFGRGILCHDPFNS